jgi:hypothetical protein
MFPEHPSSPHAGDHALADQTALKLSFCVRPRTMLRSAPGNFEPSKNERLGSNAITVTMIRRVDKGGITGEPRNNLRSMRL